VGKSTLAANLSAYYASRGLKTLHIGCDPKSDSTLILLKNMDELSTVMSWISNADNDREPGAIFNEGRLGIKCIEAGGPEAGIGCGGRGIARVMELLDKWKILERGEFDTVLFDVLGDVVCGGFAAPLRKGFGNKVAIVIAEDEMSYFAANNIAKAVLRYSVNGASLAGIVVNQRGSGGAKLKADKFASMIGANILGNLPQSETPALARRDGLTAVEYDPSSEFSIEVASIAEKLLSMELSDTPLPTPLEQKAFMMYLIDPEGLRRSRGGKHQEHPAAANGCANNAAPIPNLRREDDKLAAAFSQLLGLRGEKTSGPGFDVVYVERKQEVGIRMFFSGPAVGRAVVSLRPKGTGVSPAIATAHFDIFLDEGKTSKPFVRLLQLTAHRLGNFRLEELETIYSKCFEPVRSVPEAGNPPVASGASVSSEKWALFFAREQFARNMAQTLFYDIPVAQITHSDIECAFATPPIKRDEFNPYNYPWLSPLLELDSPRFNKDSKYYQTHLEEMDVVLGAEKKLSSVISNAIRELGSQKLLVFNNTCVPVVSGEDVPSIVAAAGERCPVPLLYEGPENSISINPYHDFFIGIKDKIGFMERETIPLSVNLIGFPDNKGREEIISILNAMGVIVNMVFLPNINSGIFEHYRAAALTVFNPDDAYRLMYEQIFGDVPIKTIKPPAPYGMRRTREWFGAVAGELGIQGDKLKTIKSAEDNVLEEWNDMAEQARKFTLGFVLPGNHSGIFSRPELTGGTPLLEAVQEMGFGTQFLNYCAAETELSLSGRISLKREIGAFSTPAELEKLMAESQAQCFYSDYYFDERLVKAGKSQFSLQQFEMGFAGAVRSIRRIVDACSVPFFKRYMKYAV